MRPTGGPRLAGGDAISTALARAFPTELETFAARYGGPSIGTMTQYRLYFARVVNPRAFTIPNLQIYNGGTVAGNVLVGVYSFDGTTMTKLAGSALTLMAGANARQTITLATPYNHAGCPVWMCMGSDSATAQFFRSGSGAGPANGAGDQVLSVTLSSGAFAAGLPATQTGLAADNVTPWVFGKAA